MEYRVLGPLEVLDGGQVLGVGTRKQRALLTLLLMAANRVVTLDVIMQELWADEPPAQATNSLRVYISNLRRLGSSSWSRPAGGCCTRGGRT